MLLKDNHHETKLSLDDVTFLKTLEESDASIVLVYFCSWKIMHS